jgi:outer membrane protein
MRSLLSIAAALLAAGAPLASTSAAAQGSDTTTGPVLTLDEAITLATKNNPEHLQVVDKERAASAAQRSAFGQLLPSVDASFSSLYRQQGNQPINGVSSQSFGVSSDVYQSSYNLGLNYRLSAASFINPRLQAANVNAAEADIAGSAEGLRAAVAQRYLTVLQSQAKAELQDTLINALQGQLELAKAKLAVGSGTQLDVTRAEVNLGQQQVAAIQAHNQVEIDKLRLFQQMGVPQPANVRLVSSFEIKEPDFSLDSVMQLAQRENPTLHALQSRDRAAGLNVRAEQSQYLPTLQVQTGWGGYTYQYSNPDVLIQGQQSQMLSSQASCFSTDSLRVRAGLPSISGQCASMTFTDADAAALRRQNNQFPFNFTKQPLQVSAVLSIPIFDGFERERRVQQAQADRNDARYKIRSQELALRADVTAAYLTLQADAKSAAIQEQNAAKAKQELQLAQERYRVGAATFLDLNDARASYERAENDRINAVYEFHKAFAALESVVGHPLR